MPLRVFTNEGTASSSDIARAIYYAVNHGARVINMSFSLETSSPELLRALNYANEHEVISVAAAGNSGEETLVFPAAFRHVIGVGSTSNRDKRSRFSNFGNGLVRLAAPGEGLITSYPGGRYAAVWGTSFSAALVSGGASLLVDAVSDLDPNKADELLSKAKRVGQDLGQGRLDLFAALQKATKK
jgi:subtilisin family serine protease